MTDAGPASSARGRPLLLGIFLTSEHRSLQLQGQLAAAGWHIVLLPAPATGMRIWIDQPVDAPLPLLKAGQHRAAWLRWHGRPLMVLTSGWSRDQRLLAFEAGD